MDLICPKCDTVIQSESYNQETGLYICNSCNSLHKISEVKSEDRSGERNNPPPPGSKLVVSRSNDSIEINFPALGASGKSVLAILFAVFWMTGCISFTLASVKDQSLLLIIFLIPFWTVGIALLMSVIFTITESQKIRINKDSIAIIRERPFLSTTSDFQIANIQSVEIGQNRVLKFSFNDLILKMKLMFLPRRVRSVEMPVIRSIGETLYFFEGATLLDQEWIISVLNRLIQTISDNNSKG